MKILIADNDGIWRNGFSQALNSIFPSDFEFKFEHRGTDVPATVEQTRPEILVLDVFFDKGADGSDGISDVLPRIRGHNDFSTLPVVVMSNQETSASNCYVYISDPYTYNFPKHRLTLEDDAGFKDFKRLVDYVISEGSFAGFVL